MGKRYDGKGDKHRDDKKWDKGGDDKKWDYRDDKKWGHDDDDGGVFALLRAGDGGTATSGSNIGNINALNGFTLVGYGGDDNGQNNTTGDADASGGSNFLTF